MCSKIGVHLRVTVVGLGKLGLPLAVYYASKGAEVVGVDKDDSVVSRVMATESFFPNELNLESKLKEVIERGNFTATTKLPEAVATSDVVVLTVPLAVDFAKRPDYSQVVAVAERLGRSLQRGSLVIAETTMPIGSTRNVLNPAIEENSNMKEGEDYYLVYSPERVLTGRVFEDLEKYPKLIGALSLEGARLATSFFNSIIDFLPREDLDRENGVWDMGSPEAAEFAKLAETTYRDVNIALANQFALHASTLGINVRSVIEACNSQSYSHIHTPGISVGGHCIPVYPHLYLNSDPNPGVVGAARSLNAEMPRLALTGFVNDLKSNPRDLVLILGLSYRPGVKEAANSGAFQIADLLREKSIEHRVLDPLFSNEEILSLGLQPLRDSDKITHIILHTAHREFELLSKKIFPHVLSLFDGRGVLDKAQWPGVVIHSLG